MEANVRGVLLCCHAALPGMIQRRRGRIINLSSSAASMTLPMSTSYSCSKAAVLRLTDALARSVQSAGVFVFAISPGTVHTGMTDHILNSPEGRRWLPEFQRIPENQWIAAEKVGTLVVRLASGEADALTGRFIHVSSDLGKLAVRAGEIQEHDLLTLRIRE